MYPRPVWFGGKPQQTGFEKLPKGGGQKKGAAPLLLKPGRFQSPVGFEITFAVLP
jgi:hypothetical protein